jgi:hypothetical protein
MVPKMLVSIVLISAVIIWVLLFVSLFTDDKPEQLLALQQQQQQQQQPLIHHDDKVLSLKGMENPDAVELQHQHNLIVEQEQEQETSNLRKGPRRNNVEDTNVNAKPAVVFHAQEQEEIQLAQPITIAEVSRNITLYLTLLHSALAAVAGKDVNAVKAWEAYRYFAFAFHVRRASLFLSLCIPFLSCFCSIPPQRTDVCLLRPLLQL